MVPDVDIEESYPPGLFLKTWRGKIIALLMTAGPAGSSPTPEPLTEREVEVLQLVAQGLSNQEIAERLVIGEVTVRTHIGNILTKLHLANRVQAALYALRKGLSTLNDGENTEE